MEQFILNFFIRDLLKFLLRKFHINQINLNSA